MATILGRIVAQLLDLAEAIKSKIQGSDFAA